MAHPLLSAAVKRRLSVRESYLYFPTWTQPFWTRLTGKPLPLEQPIARLPVTLAMWLDLVMAVLACMLHLSLLAAADTSLLLIGYGLTPIFALYLTGALRKAQVVYGHHAIHGTLFKQRSKANDHAARGLTIIALSQNEAEYEQDHLDHHRRTIFTTLHDADAALLYRCGVQPGKPLEDLKRALLATLVSPRYHLWFLKARLMSNLRRPPLERAIAIVWMALIFIIVPLQYGVVAACMALWLPLTILYQMSALLQFATEHVWLTGEAPGANALAYAQRCHGRFSGERVPGTDGSPASARTWLAWWTRTLCIHVPTRLAVLVGDLPAHDWHHLVAAVGHSASSWPHAIYERQRAIDSGNSAGMEERELWGIGDMVCHVLLSMSRAPAQLDAHRIRQEASPANSL
ncbi:fatty acid desaturase [Ralstonia sp. 24A2]|uniref:fatty acid desaturase n=1 Tax=Ralstonia sp. 24A2 TaxID=3447364 RepID=UPI003F6A3B11